MRRKNGRYTTTQLPAMTKLSCGCDSRDEIGSGRASFGDITGFEAVMDDTRPDIAAPRVMRTYADGTMRHVRCGQISKPV